jgi:DNA-directed RNA polymerase III subunit RPC6
MALSSTQLVSYKNKIYDACLPLIAEDPTKTFSQSSILELGIIPDNDLRILLQVSQALVNDKLFKIIEGNGLAWRLRSQEEAKKYVVPFPNLQLDKSTQRKDNC